MKTEPFSELQALIPETSVEVEDHEFDMIYLASLVAKSGLQGETDNKRRMKKWQRITKTYCNVKGIRTLPHKSVSRKWMREVNKAKKKFSQESVQETGELPLEALSETILASAEVNEAKTGIPSTKDSEAAPYPWLLDEQEVETGDDLKVPMSIMLDQHHQKEDPNVMDGTGTSPDQAMDPISVRAPVSLPSSAASPSTLSTTSRQEMPLSAPTSPPPPKELTYDPVSRQVKRREQREQTHEVHGEDRRQEQDQSRPTRLGVTEVGQYLEQIYEARKAAAEKEMALNEMLLKQAEDERAIWRLKRKAAEVELESMELKKQILELERDEAAVKLQDTQLRRNLTITKYNQAVGIPLPSLPK